MADSPLGPTAAGGAGGPPAGATATGPGQSRTVAPTNALSSERYLAWLYSPQEQQPVLAALCQIEAEVAASLRQGIEHHVAHARLQWWRDECERAAQGRPAHPLTRELVRALGAGAAGVSPRLPGARKAAAADAPSWGAGDDTTAGATPSSAPTGNATSSVSRSSAPAGDPTSGMSPSSAPIGNAMSGASPSSAPIGNATSSLSPPSAPIGNATSGTSPSSARIASTRSSAAPSAPSGNATSGVLASSAPIDNATSGTSPSSAPTGNPTSGASAFSARIGNAIRGIAGFVDTAVWDLAGATFETRKELTAYCERWAAAMFEAASLGSSAPGGSAPAAALRVRALGAAVREVELLAGLAREAHAGRLRVPLDELERAGVDVSGLAKVPWPAALVNLLRERHESLRETIASSVSQLGEDEQASLRGLLVWATLAWRLSRRAQRALPNVILPRRYHAIADGWHAWRAAHRARAGKLRLVRRASGPN